MSQLTPRPVPALSVKLAPPSSNLRTELLLVEGAHPAYGYQPSRLLTEVGDEARGMLAAYESCKAPPSKGLIDAWLKPLVSAVRNPPCRSDFDEMVRLLVLVLDDTPSVMLTEESQINAMREFAFWPATADIYKFLLPQANAFYKRRYALMEIVNSIPVA